MEFPFYFKDIQQVKFYLGEIGFNIDIEEIDISFEDLLLLINRVEKESKLGSSLHKEAFTGIDFLGNSVKFDCYYIILPNMKIFKYNFNEDWIPFNEKIKIENREKNVNNLLK